MTLCQLIAFDNSPERVLLDIIPLETLVIDGGDPRDAAVDELPAQ